MNSNTYGMITVVGVIFLLLLGYVYISHFKESMTPDNEFFDDLRELDIKLFYSPNCSFCKEYLKMLKKHNLENHMEMVDISTGNGRAEFESLGEPGVPVTLSQKTSIKFAGKPKDILSIPEKLKTIS